MADCNVSVIGVYRVPFSNELLETAMNIKYEGIDLSFLNRWKAKKSVKKELSSVVLIEVIVDNPIDKFEIEDFGQPKNDQAPYDEAYLSLDGDRILSKFDIPNEDKIRITFFLHYYDPKQPLLTSCGEVSCPPVEDMPERLKELVPYEPVD